MQLEKEIERAVYHQAGSDTNTKKSKEEINSIIQTVKKSLKKSEYDFSVANSIVLNQDGKKRFVKLFSNIYSTESILCQCIKQILDKTFRVKYPNRNKTVKSLFEIFSAVRQMSDFTIIKFDFKDYFNSISAIYVFEKFMKEKLHNRFETELIENFVYKTKYTYAGFNTSNAMAEIVARHFDDAVRQKFMSKGILFFERYIDDSILILNENINESEIKDSLHEILENVFYDDTIPVKERCKTKFNDQKFQYISRRKITDTAISIDYLGYEFWFSLDKNKKINIQYGITQAKRDKYNKRIDKFIGCYKNDKHIDFKNLELLRHRIVAFTSREVYLNKRYQSNVWKVKGFISNYGELRYFLGTSFLHKDTENFLKNMVQDAFVRADIKTPYFLKDIRASMRYNLFENMKSNKTILLVEKIGYDYNSIVRLCSKIGINNLDRNGKKRGYGTLVRDYLIKVKVGY